MKELGIVVGLIAGGIAALPLCRDVRETYILSSGSNYVYWDGEEWQISTPEEWDKHSGMRHKAPRE